MVSIQTLDLAKLTASDFASGKGAKTASFRYDGQSKLPIFLLCESGESVRSPFGASVYGDAAVQASAKRFSLDFEVTDLQSLPVLQALDEFAVKYAVANKERMFPGQSSEDVAKMYCSCLKTNEKYSQTCFHTKISSVGINRVRLFSATCDPIEFGQTNLADAALVPAFQLKGFWAQGKSFGISCETVQCQCFERAEASCLFAPA